MLLGGCKAELVGVIASTYLPGMHLLIQSCMQLSFKRQLVKGGDYNAKLGSGSLKLINLYLYLEQIMFFCRAMFSPQALNKILHFAFDLTKKEKKAPNTFISSLLCLLASLGALWQGVFRQFESTWTETDAGCSTAVFLQTVSKNQPTLKLQIPLNRSQSPMTPERYSKFFIEL